jgi:hypothetical protein
VGAAILYSAYLSDARRSAQAKYSVLAPVVLCVAVVSLGYFAPLLRTYEDFGRLSRANSENLASGFQTSSPQMTYWDLPTEGIIDEEPVPVGAYDRPAVIGGFGYGVFPNYLLGFFDKQHIVVRLLPVDPGKIASPSPAVK